MSRTIKGSDIIADLRAGMNDSELMKKYALSLHELESVHRQIRSERDARLFRIASDLMKGLQPSAVMKIHGISSKSLQTVLDCFSMELTLEMPDSAGQRGDASDRVIIDYRKEPRHKPVEVIWARSRASKIRECFLRDISLHGLALVGAGVRVHDIGEVAILGDDTGRIEPFELKAECRWSGTDRKLGRPVAGFMIADISPSNSLKLQELLENYTKASRE